MSSAAQSRGVCAVTGADGYLGSRVARRLAEAGWTIEAFSRRRGKQGVGNCRVHFELGEGIAPTALADIDALVHAAYDFSASRWCDIKRINVDGSRRLFAAAHAANVERIVLVSSIAAFPGARSLYGRAKLEIERAGLDVGAAVVRPGLIWGPESGGMLGSLERMVERLMVVPTPVPRELEVRLTHEDDVAILIAGILGMWPADKGKVLVAVPEKPIMFADLLHSLAGQTNGQTRFVRLPWRAVWLGLQILEAIGLRPPFRSDSLVSLLASDRDPLSRATAQTEKYVMRLRPYRK